jgi:acetyl-CoA carboxylase carboxyltransferase component
MGGHVVGFVANNSAVASGQIDTHAALKGTRFIRFCNIYNIPMIFIEDVSGFMPGLEQERAGIVQAGRKLLDAIIDIRTPRMTMIIRNAIGGAYAAWNSHFTGADRVFAMPMARIAVMGSAGVQFIYKDEFRGVHGEYQRAMAAGEDEAKAARARDEGLKALNDRYEHELMNPKEALALGSVSSIVMPGESRRVLAASLQLLMSKYTPSAMSGVQREHE